MHTFLKFVSICAVDTDKYSHVVSYRKKYLDIGNKCMYCNETCLCINKWNNVKLNF